MCHFRWRDKFHYAFDAKHQRNIQKSLGIYDKRMSHRFFVNVMSVVYYSGTFLEKVTQIPVLILLGLKVHWQYKLS